MNIYDTNYGQKKGWESKCQINSQPLKVENHFESHVWRKHATCRWKSLDEGYNFAQTLILVESMFKKLWASKMVGVHLGVAPVAHHI